MSPSVRAGFLPQGHCWSMGWGDISGTDSPAVDVWAALAHPSRSFFCVWLQWWEPEPSHRDSDLALREWRITESQDILSWKGTSRVQLLNTRANPRGLPQAQVLPTLGRKFSLTQTRCRDLTNLAAGRSLNACPRGIQAVKPCVQWTFLRFGACFLSGMAAAAHMAPAACFPLTGSPWLVFLSGKDAWSRLLL